MTTTLAALATLSHRVARCFHHLFSRLLRKAEVDISITFCFLPFFKISLDYKADLRDPADDKKPRPA